MPEVTLQFRTCSACGSLIPPDADQINRVCGQVTIGGVTQGFDALDFCCSEHLNGWLAAAPQVPTPTNLLQPPTLPTSEVTP